jgi:hypothetical protein
MATKGPAKRRKPKPATSRGLLRVTAFLHRDEYAALVSYAEQKGITLSEALRRIVRARFAIED